MKNSLFECKNSDKPAPLQNRHTKTHRQADGKQDSQRQTAKKNPIFLTLNRLSQSHPVPFLGIMCAYKKISSQGVCWLQTICASNKVKRLQVGGKQLSTTWLSADDLSFCEEGNGYGTWGKGVESIAKYSIFFPSLSPPPTPLQYVVFYPRENYSFLGEMEKTRFVSSGNPSLWEMVGIDDWKAIVVAIDGCLNQSIIMITKMTIITLNEIFPMKAEKNPH